MENRRYFLKVLGASAALAIGCGSDTGQSEASGTFAAGNVSALPVGTIRAIDGQPLVIARDAGGVYAMSTICTHQQCDMNGGSGRISNSELVCTCHDSHFDTNGTPTSGPAGSPLKHFQVTINAAGEITIDASTTVASGVRVAVA